MKQTLLLALALFTGIISFAQTVGTKVSFKTGDGKTYTGAITEIRDNRYKIKFDGTESSSWLTAGQFNIADGTVATPQPDTAQKAWKVGDKVEVQDMYNSFKWENATITQILTNWYPVKYKATLDEPAGHTVSELLLIATQIREKGTQSTIEFAVNSRVDVSNSDGTPKARGSIIKISGDRYKIHYDGCATTWDEQVTLKQLRPAATLSPNDPAVTSLTGNWAMFAYVYPVAKGNTGQTDSLQINADGTYIWYDTYNKPPVKGTWTPHAKFDGVRNGTEIVNGILLKDSKGIQWKFYKNGDVQILGKKMCTSETQGGTKMKK
jgi:hypothetical protein